jgi:hypothetical protein
VSPWISLVMGMVVVLLLVLRLGRTVDERPKDSGPDPLQTLD